LQVRLLERPVASLGAEVERVVVGRLGELHAVLVALCQTLAQVGSTSAEVTTASYGTRKIWWKSAGPHRSEEKYSDAVRICVSPGAFAGAFGRMWTVTSLLRTVALKVSDAENRTTTSPHQEAFAARSSTCDPLMVTESPEANTLHYNLGLIYFKLNRLEDAESSFLKALDLSKGNPKINFYLGSIYERLHRHKDAIYQYRQAGANLMVRRVEDKMAASGPSKGAKKSGRKDDTAEFPKQEIQDRLRRHADEALARADQALAMGKVLQPVSPSLLADGAPSPGSATGKVFDREETSLKVSTERVSAGWVSAMTNLT